MGSLNASGSIPVVGKQTKSWRRLDSKITQVDSSKDVKTTYTDYRPELNRVISSGSIVRDDNISPAQVEYYEDISWGVQLEARSSSARVARDGSRDLKVENEEVVTIEDSLKPNKPQEWSYQLGDTVVKKDSVTNDVVARVPSSGIV